MTFHRSPYLRSATREAYAVSVGADWRIVTRIYGGLLGTEYLICTGEKYFRIGELTIQLLLRGTPPAEIEMLEVDPDGEPVEYEADDRACSIADQLYQSKREEEF